MSHNLAYDVQKYKKVVTKGRESIVINLSSYFQIFMEIYVFYLS